MRCGTVKLWNGGRGYGFLKPDDGGVDLFVHISGLSGTTELVPGDLVEFDEGEDERSKRPIAVNVRTAR